MAPNSVQSTCFLLILLFLIINNTLSSTTPSPNQSSSAGSSTIPPATSTSPASSTSSASTSSLPSSPTFLPSTPTIPTTTSSNNNTNTTCQVVPPICSDGSCCSFKLAIPASTHKYLGGLILVGFVIGQTIHYFYLEDKKAKAYKADEPAAQEKSNVQKPGEEQDEEEKDRRERLAYGISTNSYLVRECTTPRGRVTKVLEKRPRQSFALAPPITPASANGMYESRVKTVIPKETLICQIRVTADKWGRGTELISLINDTEVPMGTAEEKAKFVMETVQGHMEKMTEQKVFLHGLLEDRHRLLCGSDNMDSQMFSEVRLELKLEMTAPVLLLISVFLVKMEPQIEQPKTVPPGARTSELTSIPNKETPRTEKPATVEQNNKGKSTVSDSLEGKEVGKEVKASPEKNKEKKDSSRRKGSKKTSDLSELAPLLAPVVQSVEKVSKDKTPKTESAAATPEKPSSGQAPPSTLRKKKKESTSGQIISNPSPSTK